MPAVAEAVPRSAQESPFFTLANTLGNMPVLAARHASVGLVYESEKGEPIVS